jgi:hypothetical protein
LKTVAAGHEQVADDGRGAVFQGGLNPLLAVLGFTHRPASPSERLGKDLAHDGVIIDQEDGFHRGGVSFHVEGGKNKLRPELAAECGAKLLLEPARSGKLLGETGNEEGFRSHRLLRRT